MSSLLPFTTYTNPRYQADPAHHLIASYLDRVVHGQILRLMIFAPPQIGKSTLSSVAFPAFWLAHRPDDALLMNSYASGLIEKHSRNARNIVWSDSYKRLFPHIRASTISRAVDHWELASHSGYVHAVGLDGSLTGFGGKAALVDDPYSGWKAAQSETVRAAVYDWWVGDLENRLGDMAAIVLTMTRWHPKDIAGELLKKQPGIWTVLRIPALGESQYDRDRRNAQCGLPSGLPDPLGRAEGEPAAPRRHSKTTLMTRKLNLGNRVWEAEYMGAPTNPEGNLFKRHWFKIVAAVPVEARRVRRWDHGATEGDGDYTVGVLMAATPDGRFYIEHIVRGQWSPHQRKTIQRQTAQLDDTRYGIGVVEVVIPQDPGSAGVADKDDDIRNLAGFFVSAERETGEKMVRLQPFAAQCEGGNVFLLEGAWNEPYIEEMCALPNGANDDQADASGGAFNMLALPLWQVY